MNENELTDITMNCAFDVHKYLVPGLLESAYEKVLCFELKEKGLSIESQKQVSLNYKGMVFEQGVVEIS